MLVSITNWFQHSPVCTNIDDFLELFVHHTMTMAGKYEEMAAHLPQTVRMFAA
jgi:hypothetical protein